MESKKIVLVMGSGNLEIDSEMTARILEQQKYIPVVVNTDNVNGSDPLADITALLEIVKDKGYKSFISQPQIDRIRLFCDQTGNDFDTIKEAFIQMHRPIPDTKIELYDHPEAIYKEVADFHHKEKRGKHRNKNPWKFQR